MNIDRVINELNKFSEVLVHFGPPVTDNRFEVFEKKIEFVLPDDYKSIIKIYNGFSLNGTEVYSLDPDMKGKSLDVIYNFEHYEVGNPMPKYFLPISPDGAGNHYCIDLSMNRKGVSPIVFWQHDFNYKKLGDVEVCNVSFVEWVNEVMIEWTLEDYNYDGTEK